MPFDLVGVTYALNALGCARTGGPTFVDFDFPVLFLAHADDRIAYTSAFLAELRRRPRTCRFVEAPAGGGHFFPYNCLADVGKTVDEWLGDVDVVFRSSSSGM